MRKRLIIAMLILAVFQLNGCGGSEEETSQPLVEVEIESISDVVRSQATEDDGNENGATETVDSDVIEGDEAIGDTIAEEVIEEKTVSELPDEPTTDKKAITVAVTGSPATDILELANKAIEYSGYHIEILKCSNYKEINQKVNNGIVYASLCENEALLESYNKLEDSDLVIAERVFVNPLAIFPGKDTDLRNISNGITIAVVEGDVNVARALYLLEQKGLVEIKEGASYQATLEDVTSNPYNIKIEQVNMDSAWPDTNNCGLIIADYNRAVLNGIDPASAVGEENRNSKILDLFAVGLVVKDDNVNNEKTKELLKAINSDEVEDMIAKNYYESVLDYK